MSRLIAYALILLMPLTAAAQNQASIKDLPEGSPPQVPVFSGPEPRLTSKERKGVDYGREWANNRDKPARGEEGGIVFPFGATLPTIVCAQYYVCDLALQEGEVVNDIHVGDSVRWKVEPARQGAGEATITHVFIKPTDVGLTTNLLITTTRRTYTIKLLSTAHDWMPRVSFQYPDDVTAQWKAYRVAAEQRREMGEASAPLIPRKIDTSFSISGDNPVWRPTQVYSDGVKTFIVFPRNVGSGDLPVLIALAEDKSFLGLESLFYGPTADIVNYRFTDHQFEVDKVLDRARLISGTGDQQAAVTITRSRKD